MKVLCNREVKMHLVDLDEIERIHIKKLFKVVICSILVGFLIGFLTMVILNG